MVLVGEGVWGRVKQESLCQARTREWRGYLVGRSGKAKKREIARGEEYRGT